MVTRRRFAGAAAFAIWNGVRAADGKPRPNILLVSCENLGPHLGCYEYASVATPSIDAFAASAGTIRFAQAFAVSGIGPVSRSSIQTGMFPTTIGSHFDGRAALPSFAKTLPEYLKLAGYRIVTASSGAKKASAAPVHSTAPTFTWKRLDAVNHSKVRLRGAEYERTIRAARATLRARSGEDAPFPPHFEDNDESRRDWLQYHELITMLDRQFAAAIRGVADDTVILFCGEFGFTLREGNSAAYESGTRVPLLIRVPGGGAAASVSQRRVMLLDLAPTILNLAGIAIPAHMQGQAFLGERTGPQRRTAFAAVDRADLRYEVVRSIRSGSYRYVCNYTKGTEELFDSDRDPHEVKNLAESDPATLSRLREQLDRWRADTRDLGLIPEAEVAAREALVRTRYAVGRQAGFEALQQRLSMIALTKDEAKVREAFADADAAVRTWACTKPGAAVADLRRALSDPNGSVRIEAAFRLRKASNTDSGAMRVLLREAVSQEEWLRFAAILAIGELGERDPKAVEIVRNASKSDANRTVAALAMRVWKGLEGGGQTPQ